MHTSAIKGPTSKITHGAGALHPPEQRNTAIQSHARLQQRVSGGGALHTPGHPWPATPRRRPRAPAATRFRGRTTRGTTATLSAPAVRMEPTSRVPPPWLARSIGDGSRRRCQFVTDSAASITDTIRLTIGSSSLGDAPSIMARRPLTNSFATL